MSELWEIPATWTWSRMGDVASVVGGGTPDTKNAGYFGGDIPWLTPADLSGYTAKRISRGTRSITQAGLDNSGAQIMPAGTVLFSSRAPIGYVVIASNPICTNQGFKSFVLERGLNPDFVYYYLHRAKPLAVKLASGTTFLEISGANASQIPIPVPPIAEQERIADALDELLSDLDASVAALERVRDKLKLYRAAVLKAAVEGVLTAEWRRQHPQTAPASDLLKRILAERRRRWEEEQLRKFKEKGREPPKNWKAQYKEPMAPDTTDLPSLPEGWCWASFEQVSMRVTVGHVGPMKDEYVETGIPFLRNQNVRENKFDPEGLLFITPEFHARLAKSTIHPGDIAVVRSGAVGVSCVIPDTLHEANCADLVLIQRPVGILPHYGAYYLNSAAKIDIRRGQVGIALIHFNTKSVAALAVAVPPLAEQELIVEAVEDQLSIIDHLESDLAAKQANAQALRQSILRHAFSGKLVPQDPNDEPAAELLKRIAAERAQRAREAAVTKRLNGGKPSRAAKPRGKAARPATKESQHGRNADR